MVTGGRKSNIPISISAEGHESAGRISFEYTLVTVPIVGRPSAFCGTELVDVCQLAAVH